MAEITMQERELISSCVQHAKRVYFMAEITSHERELIGSRLPAQFSKTNPLQKS